MLAFPHIIAIALIQGITEFLPVSSSGHLVLLPALTEFADQGQHLDVAAHIGTLGAVLLYFYKDIWAIIIGVLTLGKKQAEAGRLGWLVLLASLPVMAAGLLIEMWDPAFLRLALTVAIANIIFALWLWRADKQPAEQPLSALSVRHAFLIGLAQILALIPGASRSGVTMTAARQFGYERLGTARFSLLLSIPVILAAGTVKSISLARETGFFITSDSLWVAGLSFITALIAIRLMMGWLAKADFRIFVFYRLILGAGLLGALALGLI